MEDASRLSTTGVSNLIGEGVEKMRPKRNTFLLKINRAYASVLLKKRELDGFNIGLYLAELSIRYDRLLTKISIRSNINVDKRGKL